MTWTMTWPEPRAARRLAERCRPLLLAVLGLLVFRDGFQHEFTNWDDPQYIVENPLIRGLSAGRVWAAFTGFHVFNYNPLHIVSYMVDHQLWGLQAGGFFLTSLILHVLTGVAAYHLALRWSGSANAALFVAAVFLVHPTRVESVAWLSERKDVLSGLFAMTSLLAYWRHLDGACSPAPGRGASGATRGPYLASLALYVLALLSKSQLVSLPLVLLAMDVSRRRPLGPALLSKAPFFAFSAVFCVVTLLGHTGDSLRDVTLPERLLSPLAALAHYLLHLLWPVGLSPYYDATRGFPEPAFVAAGAAAFAALSAAAWISLHRQRSWFLGIAWLLAFLLPVLGFIRTNVAFADRYLYLAAVGPVAAAAAQLARLPRPRVPIALAGAATIAVLSAITASCVPVFRDSESLWLRVLERSPGASLAHSNLGHHLLTQGRLEEAARHYDADLAERPYFESTLLGRALIHEVAGDPGAARRMYALALEKRSQSVLARLEYADFLGRLGEREAALDVLRDLDRAHATVPYYHKLFDLCRELGLEDEAREAARRAMELAPYDPGSQYRFRVARI
ncbi:MAG: tetratricopeptide repeat protein [Planctomycetes bacterium]|nr:tetratricopeptide repeat protein [Planctomycetota bacterium]